MNKLNYIMIPVIIIVCIAAISFYVLLQSVVVTTDETALKTNKRIFQTHLNQLTKNLTGIASDNARWEAAYQKIHVNLDLDWLEENFSVTSPVYTTVDISFIYGTDNKIIYSFREGNVPDPEILLRTGLEDYLQTLTLSDYYSTNDSSGIIQWQKRIFIFGVSLVQRTTADTTVKIIPERRPAIVFVYELTHERLDNIGANLEMNNIRPVFGVEAQDGFLRIDKGLSDRVYSDIDNMSFVWNPVTPGRDFVDNMVMPMIIVALLVLVAFLFFYINVSKLFIALKMADQAKSTFLANMSHEIRTPLNAIIGFSEIMYSGIFGKIENLKYREYLQDIKNSGHHLESVINDILDLSKIEVGKWHLNESEFDLKSCIKDAIKIIKLQANDKNISLKITDLENGNLIKIYGEESAYKRIFINLLSNSVKFTGVDGLITVGVTILADGFVKIDVADNGIGIATDKIKQVLIPFSQVHDIKSSDNAGTGLGLPIVKKLAELHGGSFSISSEKNVGTITTVLIPAYRVIS